MIDVDRHSVCSKPITVSLSHLSNSFPNKIQANLHVQIAYVQILFSQPPLLMNIYLANSGAIYN